MVAVNTESLELAQTLRDRLRDIFGERLRGIVLYGSRARGDARMDSDFDFLVLLDFVESFGVERGRMSRLLSELSLERDIVVSALPTDEDMFSSSGLPFYRNVRREGLVLR